MKKYLQDLIAKKQKRAKELRQSIKDSESVDEVRSLGDELTSIEVEISDAQSQLDALEEVERNAGQGSSLNEQRGNNFNPVAAFTQNQSQQRSNEEVDTRATMEYRKAFKAYIQRGIVNKEVLQFEQRANATGTSADLGVLIPTTVIQEIIKDVEKNYGSLYSKVKKTNLKGGVKYPLGSFSATFKRITENTVSDKQKAGEVNGYVEFSYNIGEIKLARTLLEVVLSVDAFEREFAEIIAEAYVEAMDKEVMTGDPANNEMTGILTEAKKTTDSRIPADHIIDFTDAEIADWTKWESKFFAQIPLSLENAFTEFVMAKQTYSSNLCTLKDNNNQPINKAGFDVTDKQHKFNEYPVNRVEKDIFKDFDSCANGEYFGMLWLPKKAYAINTNLDFYIVDYFDQETNQYVKKALVINDGRILDPKYIYLLRKKVTG